MASDLRVCPDADQDTACRALVRRRTFDPCPRRGRDREGRRRRRPGTVLSHVPAAHPTGRRERSPRTGGGDQPVAFLAAKGIPGSPRRSVEPYPETILVRVVGDLPDGRAHVEPCLPGPGTPVSRVSASRGGAGGWRRLVCLRVGYGTRPPRRVHPLVIRSVGATSPTRVNWSAMASSTTTVGRCRSPRSLASGQ